MPAIDAARRADLQARFPDVLRPTAWRRFGRLVVASGVLGYFLLAWIAFDVGKTVRSANWDIAGAYLADWVSYEARPDVDFEDGHLDIAFPRFSPLGPNPEPDWLEVETDVREIAIAPEPVQTEARPAVRGFMQPGEATAEPTTSTAASAPAEQAGVERREVAIRAAARLGGAVVRIEPGSVHIERGEELLRIAIAPGEVRALSELPDWASQRREGGKIILRFGFSGRVEVEDDEVKIRKRFFGWENFLFDTSSRFWGMSWSELGRQAFLAERLDPARGNLSAMAHDVLHNAEWQHLDVWTKLLQTIVMAFVGTLFASLLAFPLAFLAARTITASRLVNHVTKRVFDFLRSVDMLIWALFFTRAFGPGPLAGISAIFVTDTGTLGKLYSEALENVDDKPREGVKSLGAAPILVQRYGVVPQVLPVFLSQSLYFWESNTRSATIIGAVGAGGIGLKLWEAMRTNQDWENVAYMVCLILAVVFLFDAVSNTLRSRLIHGAAR